LHYEKDRQAVVDGSGENAFSGDGEAGDFAEGEEVGWPRFG